MHELVKAWMKWRPSRGPQILHGDEILLEPRTAARFTAPYRSWESFLARHDFGNDRRLHLSLLPQPFFGNIDSAPVVILTLNPGLSPIDYYSERFVPAYRRALLANLKLARRHSRFPNLCLDPRFSWHGVFTYWHRRLAGLIDAFAAGSGLRRVDALSFFSNSIATLELVPYHSSSYGLTDRVVRSLRSVKLARAFVADVLMPRARAGRTLLVVARKAGHWGIPRTKGVIVYKAAETRAAHLTPRSRGGQAILRHLRRVWNNAR